MRLRPDQRSGWALNSPHPGGVVTRRGGLSPTQLRGSVGAALSHLLAVFLSEAALTTPPAHWVEGRLRVTMQRSAQSSALCMVSPEKMVPALVTELGTITERGD